MYQFSRAVYRELSPMVVEDVLALPREPTVVAEGTTVPASLVPAERALWLLPTPEVQRERLEERGLPPAAGALYERLAARIEAEAVEAHVPVLPVDGSRGIDETVAQVEDCFAAFLPAPGTTTVAERRALLRAANLDVVMQVRGYFARPWAVGSAEEVVRNFACECGDPGCTVRIEATVGNVAKAQLVDPGHGR